MRSLRTWWQPPRSLRDREAERQVKFLELFYDLVYVVLIAELGHALAGHTDLAGLASYAFRLTPHVLLTFYLLFSCRLTF